MGHATQEGKGPPVAMNFCAGLEFESREAALRAMPRWNGLVLKLRGGYSCEIVADVRNCSNPDDAHAVGDWIMTVFPAGLGLSSSGVNGAEEQRRAKEFADIFFRMLKDETEFRMALVGVEAADWLSTFEDKLSDLKQGHIFGSGFVCSNQAWREGGGPPGYVRFSSTHMWCPWHDADF